MKLKLSVEEYKEKLRSAMKKPKGLMIVGLIGILLIFVSTLLPKSSAAKTKDFSAEDYRRTLEKSVKELVCRITGDKHSTVVVTLDSGARYVYADSATASSSDNVTETGSVQNSNSTHSYITVRNESGGEEALPITVYMPQIRGVAIVCQGGDDPTLSEQVQNAVTAALHITSSRVYITGGNGR
ncbi:MAG: hypothetical protein MJ132_00980 [Clostridia bacterium]|nr:hypothetical protein [Clostridia bacterium]